MRDNTTKKFKADDIKDILKTYLLSIVPVIVIFSVFFSFTSNTEIEKTKELLIGEQEQRAKTVNYIIEDIFKGFEEDLYLVKNSDDIKNYLNEPNKSNLSEVEQLFLRDASTKKNFDQIRLINSEGQEIIRVDSEQDEVYLKANDQLQDKKDRYYYIETSKLKEDEVFISDMDLNVENGEIEIPYKPMIRVAAPLYSDDNTYQGILIINYLGQDIIDLFNEQFKNQQYNFIESSLINEDGYYLYNKEDDNNFAFMFEGKKDDTFLKDQPELWNKMSSENKGFYQNDNKITFFMRINPFSTIATNCSIDYSWIIVSTFNLEDFPIVDQKIIFGMKGIDIIILGVVCMLILFVLVIDYYRKQDEERLNITTRIAENTNDAVVITNLNTEITYVNKAFELITGYKQDEVLGLKTNYFKSGKHSPKFYEKMWNNIRDKGYWYGEIWDKKKNGMLYPKKLSIFTIQKEYSRGVDGYMGIFTDLTSIKEEQSNVIKLKNYNMGTNLPNENLLKKLIEKSIHNKQEQFGVICFSITNYNSLLLKKDDNIQHYINILVENIKEILKEEDFVAQISKNIFVIGLSSKRNKEQIGRFIKNFLDETTKTIRTENDEVFFDIKAGISIYPDNGISPDELLHNAIIAMESILDKNEKKHMYYEAILKDNIEKEMQMNLLLRNAILKEELEVYYQPQVQIEGEKVVGAEALLRWKSKELGNVSPGAFIPLVEKTGQIIEIGYWLIERIFKDYLTMKDEISPDFRISINVSPLQFKDKDLLFKIEELADKYKVDLNNFEIEITESIFVSDINEINEKLSKFRELGMTIAIDDFGTGFSSLSYLKNLNVDKLKIDRSFIKDYPEKDNGAMAKVITNMANELQLKLITEGAEVKEQIDYLSAIGCKLIQGYYYSRPLSKDEFCEYYKMR